MTPGAPQGLPTPTTAPRRASFLALSCSLRGKWGAPARHPHGAPRGPVVMSARGSRGEPRAGSQSPPEQSPHLWEPPLVPPLGHGSEGRGSEGRSSEGHGSEGHILRDTVLRNTVLQP